MSQASQDQTKFWQAVIEAIASQPGVKVSPYNIIMASKAIACNFAGHVHDANAQLVDLGNTIPGWTLTWDGVINDSFFGMYLSWLEEIHPASKLDAKQQKDYKEQLDEINKKIIGLTDGVDQIEKAQYKQFMKDYCLQTSSDNQSCQTWLPGYNAAKFVPYWEKYRTSRHYEEQIQSLNEEFGDNLDGLTDKYNAIAQKLYGPDYQQIRENVAAAKKADPKNYNNKFTKKDPRKNFQVQIEEDGVDVWATRFRIEQGNTFKTFKKWLKTAKDAANAGSDPDVEVELSNSIDITDSSSWQFSAQAAIPVEDFFMIGISASGSHSTLDVSKYDFKTTVTYQSVINIPIGPMTTWYSSALFSKYASYKNWEQGSPFCDKTLWGPKGIFNLRIAGVIVGYQPSIKMEVSNWEHSEAHTTWSEKADFSILGIIHLGSESASGKSDYVEYKSTDTGFQLLDTSGVPKIIALVMETINYPTPG